MKEYPVKLFMLPVLVPYDARTLTPEFNEAVAALTLLNSPGVPIDDPEVRVEDLDGWAPRGYKAVIGTVRYIEPQPEDLEFALRLKDTDVGIAGVIAWPRL